MACFSYAGGGAAAFHPWGAEFADIEICALQLPGRAFRLREPPLRSISELVDRLAVVCASLGPQPLVFFGHSMGALLAFEVARRLRNTRGIELHHLIVSGRRAPQLPDVLPPISSLPRDRFLAELRRRHGTPDDVLNNAELLDLVLPVLHADFEALEGYRFIDDRPLSTPLTVLGGTEDVAVPESDLLAWRENSAGAFALEMFHGGHFFIHSNRSAVLAFLKRLLSEGA